MELSSPENGFDELNDLLKESDPCLSDELDRSYIVNKEENTADYPFGNLTSSNDFCGDDNEHMQQNPLSLPKDFSYYDFCRSPQHIFDDDVDLSEPKFAGDEERLLSSPKEYCQQGEAEDLCSDYLSRSSFQVELETMHNKTEAEVCEHILESFSKKDGTEEQEMEDRRLASPSQEGMVPESFFSMSTYESSKTELANKEVEEEYSDIPTEKLHISMMSPIGNDESESEQVHFVKKSSAVRSPETSPADVGSTEMLHSDQLAFNRSPQVSKSPDGIRQMSFTHDMSPCTYLSPGSPKTSSPQSIQESPYSSKSGRQKHHISPEESDHLTQYEKEKPASPMGSQKGARDMDDLPTEHLPASPKNHHSHQVRRRRNRSVSRSPVRQKESSSRHKREHRVRTRSRSPYGRHQHRRSPRRRHSPRHRSPPASYHSHRRSPRRRHWSPPHNRSTGLGKPGRNLFVAGFSFLTTERDLERKFSRFGRVRDVRIVRNKRSGDSRGFGFLTLERDEEADAAIRALDKTEWNGRIVLVEKSKPH